MPTLITNNNSTELTALYLERERKGERKKEMSVLTMASYVCERHQARQQNLPKMSDNAPDCKFCFEYYSSKSACVNHVERYHYNQATYLSCNVYGSL